LLVKFKRFPVIPNTVPVKFKGTSFVNFMTGVPLIINGIPLNINGRNLKSKGTPVEKTSYSRITGVAVVQLQL
jgi:hypothetical protein